MRWAAARLVRQLAASLVLLTRAVPVLLIFSIVLFVNTEMWQVFADVSDPALAGVIALFSGLGSVFVGARLPREVRELERDVGAGPPLRARQRFNVGLVLFVSQGLQVLVVAFLVGAFFVAFGTLAITPDVVESWIGHRPQAVAGQESMSVELLKVSGALGAFSGLYYAIAVLTDATYREEFLDELELSMRETFRDRARYLARRAELVAGERSAPPRGGEPGALLALHRPRSSRPRPARPRRLRMGAPARGCTCSATSRPASRRWR